jgi:hypothetical protein
VRLQAADGSELAVKKVGTVFVSRAPSALHMEPGVSRTLVEPALLTRAGPSLALTWVDSGRNVWQVEGLRAGKYTVRYVIRADKGTTATDWTTTSGEVLTAAAEVTIEE